VGCSKFLGCRFRSADGNGILLREETHSKPDFFLIVPYDCSQQGHELFHLMRVRFGGNIPAKSTHCFDVIQVASTPSQYVPTSRGVATYSKPCIQLAPKSS